MISQERIRGEAYTGEGYGKQRYLLFCAAREHILESIQNGAYLEAITIIESLITDRLESRISYLMHKNYGFKTLGQLVTKIRKCETDAEILAFVEQIDQWRAKRNQALHEMVKIETGTEVTWATRMENNRRIALEGYQVFAKIYRRVADLNPLHNDRVFDAGDLNNVLKGEEQ